MHGWRRVVLGLLLVGALVGLGIYAEATEDARSTYPTVAEIDADYGRYVGQETLLFGEVEALGDGTAWIRVSEDKHEFTLRVAGFDAPVRPGGIVMVSGTLRPDHTIEARGTTVVNPGATTNVLKYAISAVAALLFLAVFFRYWRLDLRSLTVCRRNESTGVRDDG